LSGQAVQGEGAGQGRFVNDQQLAGLELPSPHCGLWRGGPQENWRRRRRW
jgi:hypothetical protein